MYHFKKWDYRKKPFKTPPAHPGLQRDTLGRRLSPPPHRNLVTRASAGMDDSISGGDGFPKQGRQMSHKNVRNEVFVFDPFCNEISDVLITSIHFSLAFWRFWAEFSAFWWSLVGHFKPKIGLYFAWELVLLVIYRYLCSCNIISITSSLVEKPRGLVLKTTQRASF